MGIFAVEDWDVLETPEQDTQSVSMPLAFVTCTYKDEKVTRAKVKFNRKSVDEMKLTNESKVTFLFSEAAQQLAVINSNAIDGIADNRKKELFINHSTRITPKQYNQIYIGNETNIGENLWFALEAHTAKKGEKEFIYYTFTKLEEQPEKKEIAKRTPEQIAQQNSIKEWCKAQKLAGKKSTITDYWKAHPKKKRAKAKK